MASIGTVHALTYSYYVYVWMYICRSVADLGMGLWGGGAVVWRGGRGRGPPTHQQGGMGERCKLPHGGLGRSPRSFHIFRFKAAKNQRIRSAVKEFAYARKTTKFIATTRLVTVVNRRLRILDNHMLA